jgi:general secretion pathway protein K
VNARHDRGMVLIAVLFFILVSSATIVTFVAQATLDGFSARNRDRAARAEALARGGVRLAIATLIADRVHEVEAQFEVDSQQDAWARLALLPVETPDGGLLRIRVEDAGAKLGLNALFSQGEPRDEVTEIFLEELLTKVVEEIPVQPEQKLYDVSELARNLIDWVDEDDVRVGGGNEDDYYRAQDPPYATSGLPLFSVEELLLIEGFDVQLVDALRPYVDVFPFVKADGVNPNTAPDWVLALLYHGVAGSQRLADEDIVRRILDIRDQEGILCADEANHPTCVPLREAVEGEIFPPPTYHTNVFRVTAEARYGEVRRTVEAVVDRSDAEKPTLLAWRVR